MAFSLSSFSPCCHIGRIERQYNGSQFKLTHYRILGAREHFDAATRFAQAGKALPVHHLYFLNN
jgi:hypothetical protein